MYSILYVDDEQDLLELGRIFLERSSEFHVDTHVSAQDALASLGIATYDAIVSDYQMPGMDGIAFLKEVRQRFGKIPFILFTGKGREEVVIDAINNGVDFYIQKGGAPGAQFAELAHKIRQAILRQKTEQSLVESEKRLEDIINFLPDGTFAIDRKGVVIAWNHAIEEMTGIPAQEILGKGDYEYAIPFYGTRRPILIDMIGQPVETINQYYSGFSKKGNIIIAETDLPHPKGKARIMLANASPLYNRQGELAGAIETIRDITDSRKSEEELRAAYEQITAGNEELRGQYEELVLSEQMIREGEARMKFLLGFYERTSVPEKELLEYAIEGAGIVTASPMGYLAFLSDDERELTMYAWSKSTMKECAIADRPLVYSTEKTGLWGEAVRQRKPVITNDYAAPNPAKKGYPEGHPAIIRHMNIPVIDNGHIVMVAGVANKSGLYTKNDVQELSLLMQGLWQVLKRRRTEDALRDSEQKYRDLFENSVLGIFRITPDARLSAINTKFARIAGYDTPEEMMAAIHDVKTQLYVEKEDPVRLFEQLQTHGIIRDFEAQFYHKSGAVRWIKVNVTAVKDPAGQIRYYEGTIEDITGQKEAEKGLVSERALSDAIIDSIPGLLYLYDSKGRLIRWNRDHEKITGYSAKELAGMHLPDWFKEDKDAIRILAKAPWSGVQEGYVSTEAFLQTKSGKKIPFFFTAKRFEIEGKNYFAGVGIDLSEQKKSAEDLRAAYERLAATEEELRVQYDELASGEQKIRESEAQLKTVINNSPVGMHFYELKNDGTLVFTGANPAADSILGIDHRDIIGLPIEQAFPGLAGTDIPGRYLQIIADGEVLVNNRVPYTHGSITGMFSITGFRNRPGAMVVMFSDVTDAVRAEQALQESEERLRSIIETTQESVILIDEDGKVIEWNAGAERIFDIPKKEAVGSWLWDLTFQVLPKEKRNEEHRAVIEQKVRESLKTGVPVHKNPVVIETVRRDGRRLFLRQAVFTIKTDRGYRFGAITQDVTDEKRVADALRESETRFRFITENMEDMLRQLDKNGIILYISPSVVRITGYTPEELLGKPSSGFIHPDDVEQVIQQSETAIFAHKSSMRVDYRFRHRNGDYRLYESETKLLYDESGEYTGMIISSRDVTQRREMEVKLKESEAKYRRIADNSPDMIYRMALPSGQYEYISNAALAITGYAPEEIYANPEFLRSVIHPDWQDYLHRQWNELLEGRVPPEYEYQIVDRAGRVHWLNQRNVLVTGEDGKSVALEGIVTDITDRKQAEAALLEKTDEVNRFFTASIDLLCIADTDGYFRHLNPEWEKALGYPLTELEGHRFLDLVHPEDLDATRAVVADLAAQKEVIDFINRYRHRDGSYRWIEWRAFPKGPLIYAAARDITTRKAIEKALQEANRKLNLLNSITRHDVMNQVTVLSGYAQIAAMKKTDPVIAEYLERINTAAGTIARQIEFTKTYQDLGVKAPVWNRLGDMVARTDIRLPVSFSGTCRGTEVFADTMLERVFFNLFDNAARHGVKATRVLVRCEKQPEGLVVFVEDDGIGIPDAEKEKIFHRGYGKNTGLGLFLAREILAITGITIRETGTPGTGARFEILVPPGSYRTVE